MLHNMPMSGFWHISYFVLIILIGVPNVQKITQGGRPRLMIRGIWETITYIFMYIIFTFLCALWYILQFHSVPENFPQYFGIFGGFFQFCPPVWIDQVKILSLSGCLDKSRLIWDHFVQIDLVLLSGVLFLSLHK